MGEARVALPGGWGREPFARRDAIREGVTDARIRNDDLEKPFHGVRVERGGAEELVGRCRAYFAMPRPHQAVAGTTALALVGLPVSRSLQEGPLAIAVPASENRPRGQGVIAVRMRDELWEADDLDDIPTQPPVLAWLMASRVLSLGEAVIVGDALVADSDLYPGIRLPRPIASHTDLSQALLGFGRAPGSALAREALRYVAPGSASPMETKLRFTLVRAGFPMPELNVPITEDGLFLGVADLAYREARCAVEYHGEQHWKDPQQHRDDIARRRRFLAAGWTVLEVTRDDLRDGALSLIRDLRRVIR